MCCLVRAWHWPCTAPAPGLHAPALVLLRAARPLCAAQERRPAASLLPGGERYDRTCAPGGLAVQLASECMARSAAPTQSSTSAAAGGAAAGLPWVGIDPAFSTASALFDPLVRPHWLALCRRWCGARALWRSPSGAAPPAGRQLRLPPAPTKHPTHRVCARACRASQVASSPEDWYNVSAQAGQVNAQGVPYGFAPQKLPGKRPVGWRCSCALATTACTHGCTAHATCPRSAAPPLSGFPLGGYPVVVDINMPQAGIPGLMAFLAEGAYLDRRASKSLKVGGRTRVQWAWHM